MKYHLLFLLFSIILGFIFIAVPVILWLVDILFRKLLEQRLFVPKWNFWGISAAIICGLLYWFLK